jgi:starvation-inducible DNA-binding protein
VIAMTNHLGSTTEFVAPPMLAGALQSVLVELLELQAQAKQAHWNVVGPHFRSIHLELDEIVDAAREHSDTVAERMRALDAVPDGRTRTIANTTRLPSFPEGEVSVERAVAVVAERIIAVVNVIRGVHDDVDAQDPTSADILHTVLEALEKQRWMLASQLRHVTN